MQQFPVGYSTLSAKALLHLVVSEYNLHPSSTITFLKRGFNDTYLIHSEKEKYILRVYKFNWRDSESIETETKLLNYLNENNVSVSYPVKNKQATYIQPIVAPEGIRYAALFSYAEGIPVRKMTAEQSYILGVETGKIHVLTKERKLGATAQNYDISFQFREILKVIKPVLTDYKDQYNYVLRLQKEFSDVFGSINASQAATGICHGDLQAENFHISAENKITFFDFDFFGTGYLAYDIGVFMWYDHKNKPAHIINSFLKGYQTQRTLSDTEIRLLPYFSTLRALFQMTLYCKISNGSELPLWPAKEVAAFIRKVEKWHSENVQRNLSLR